MPRLGPAKNQIAMSVLPTQRPFRQSLLLSAVVIAVAALAAVILWAVTTSLWLVAHPGPL
jgi:hypothetical protein